MKYLTRSFAPQILIGLIGGLVLTLFFLWLVAAGPPPRRRRTTSRSRRSDLGQRSTSWPRGCSAAASM